MVETLWALSPLLLLPVVAKQTQCKWLTEHTEAVELIKVSMAAVVETLCALLLLLSALVEAD